MSSVKQDGVADLIKQRVISGLHLGLLSYGERLPSVRDISAEVKADPRVVLAAYRRLEEEGLVVVRERSGVFVAPRKERAGLGRPEAIVDSFVEAFKCGIAPSELPDLLRRCLAQSSRRAVVLECNDDQMFSIAGELRQDFGLEVRTVDLDGSQPVDRRTLELRGADVFITTAFHAAVVNKLSEQYGIPAIVVTMCTELFGGVRQRLEREPVYFVVTDPRFSRKLKRIFVDTPGAANLHVLVNGRDDLSQIPPGAAAYVTRITRKTLGNLTWMKRLIPEAHVFSHESGREILSFIVNTNLHGRSGAVASS